MSIQQLLSMFKKIYGKTQSSFNILHHLSLFFAVSYRLTPYCPLLCDFLWCFSNFLHPNLDHSDSGMDKRPWTGILCCDVWRVICLDDRSTWVAPLVGRQNHHWLWKQCPDPDKASESSASKDRLTKGNILIILTLDSAFVSSVAPCGAVQPGSLHPPDALTHVARCLPAGERTHTPPLQAQQNKGGDDAVRVEHRTVTAAQVGRAGPPRVEVFSAPPSPSSLSAICNLPPAPLPPPLYSQKLQTSARLKQKAAAAHLEPRWPSLWRRPMR